VDRCFEYLFIEINIIFRSLGGLSHQGNGGNVWLFFDILHNFKQCFLLSVLYWRAEENVFEEAE